MKRKVTVISFLLCLILIIPLSSFGQYSVGDTAADFTLFDIDSNQVILSDFRGDVVLINFFRTT
jgi:cytochrome oxidase Cu insertion factor (SCO1/SenC/PrrC family)